MPMIAPPHLGRICRAVARGLLAAAVLLPLPACDTMPSALNPWAEEPVYESETPIDTSEVPGADEPYPNLASVPERPEPNLSAAQRRIVVQGLVADRENAVYTDRTGPGRAAGPGEAPDVDPAPRQDVTATDITPAAQVKAGRPATVLFDARSSRLSGDARELIEEVAARQRATGARVRVVGFAGGGPEQSMVARLNLAQERARVVAFALIEAGVGRDAISVAADPIGEGEDVLGAARAEIYLGS